MLTRKRLLLLIPVILTACLLVYGLAHLFTANSLYARTIAWLESDVGDHRRFPSCTLENAGPVFQFQPVPAGDYATAWQRVADEYGSDSFEQLLERNDTTALIVIQDDRLLYENYFNGYTRESTQTSFSSAKSFVSAMVGIAIEQGAIASVEEPITTYIPELLERDPRFGEITLRHLLTMSSGIHYEEYGLPWSDDAVTYYAPDLKNAALERVRVENPPGETFHYNNYNLILEGIILERATGRTVCDYFETQIWQSLGMESPGSWSMDSERTRFAKMESGINGQAIDFAKFGRLYLRGGDWDGQQVVPSTWVAESTRADVSTDPAWWYQYHWWVHTTEQRAYHYEMENGQPIERKVAPPLENINYHYSAAGKFGQYIYVVPEQNLVIVRFGRDTGSLNWFDLFEDLAAALPAGQS